MKTQFVFERIIAKGIEGQSLVKVATSTLLLFLISLLSIPNAIAQEGPLNFDQANYFIQIEEYSVGSSSWGFFLPLQSTAMRIEGSCTYNIPISPVSTNQWLERKTIRNRDNSVYDEYTLDAEAWVNNSVSKSYCSYGRVKEPLTGITVSSDFNFASRSFPSESLTPGAPGVWNTQQYAISSAHEFTTRSVWRPSFGDAESSPLDFNIIYRTNAHVNSTRPAPSGAPASKGYSNQSTLGLLNSNPEVFYKFKVTGSSSKLVRASTNHSETNFGARIYFLNSSGTSIIAPDALEEVAGGAQDRSVEATVILSPGTYLMAIEGDQIGENGDFKVTIKQSSLSISSGSVAQPSVTNYCIDADLPTITSSSSASLNFVPNSTPVITYQWYKSIGSGSFETISGATSANLPSSKAGKMVNDPIYFKRKAIYKGKNSGYSNTVSFQPQDGLSDIVIKNNSPICSGEDGEYYLTSEDGAGDAGATVAYTLNGNALSGVLDATGRLTVTNPGMTANAAIALNSVTLNGCSKALSATSVIGVSIDAVPIACGASITANNSGGSDVINGILGNDQVGPERIYSFTVLSGSELVEINLTGMDPSKDLDLYVINPCDTDTLIARSVLYKADEQISKLMTPGEYHIVVSGFYDSDISDYTLTLTSCGVKNACEDIISLTCDTPVSDVNSDDIFFNCDLPSDNISQTTKAKVYEVIPANSGTMIIELSNYTGDHDLFLFENLCESSCAELASSENTLTTETITYTSAIAGQAYYVIVNGYQGNVSDYDLQVTCPTGEPCADDVDFVDVISNGAVCIGATGSYTIQPKAGSNSSPGATVTYTLNDMPNQIVVLDGSGMATIMDTPSAVNDTASFIVLKSIEIDHDSNSGTLNCEIMLNETALFAANGFPTSFSVVSNNGLVCEGETGIYTISGSPSVTDPTPYAEVFYDLFIDGQGTTSGSVKLDENGVGTVEVPNHPAGGFPGSSIALTSAEINGCIIQLGNGNSIIASRYANGATVTALTPIICPGADAQFEINGDPNDRVIYTLLPSGSGLDTVQLDGSGSAIITVSNPIFRETLSIYRVQYSPNNNTFFSPCLVEYDIGENYAVATVSTLHAVEIVNTNTGVCASDSLIFNIRPVAGTTVFSRSLVTYSFNGNTGVDTLQADGSLDIGFPPTSGSSEFKILSVELNGCSMSFANEVHTLSQFNEPEEVIVTAQDTSVCLGDPINFHIEPAPGAAPTPNGSVTYTTKTGAILTVTLDVNGEADIPVVNAQDSAFVSLQTISTNDGCELSLNSGINVEIVEFPDVVEVIAVSTSCTGIAEFRVQPESGSIIAEGAIVSYSINGVLDSLIIDDSGVANVLTGTESSMATTYDFTLISISNGECSISLSGTASITCEADCYDYQIRNNEESGIYSFVTEDYICSTSSIEGIGTEISYKGGDFVQLDPGFSVFANSVFTASIDNCVTDCDCGFVVSPTGSADVPTDNLLWTVNNNGQCITTLDFQSGASSKDIEVKVKGFVSGSTSSFHADVLVRRANSTLYDTTAVIVPAGKSISQLEGLFTNATGNVYTVEIDWDFTDNPIVEVEVILTPWCLTQISLCDTIANNALLEIPDEFVVWNLIENPYCLIDLDLATASILNSNLKVKVGQIVSGSISNDAAEVEIDFVSPTGEIFSRSLSVEKTQPPVTEVLGPFTGSNAITYMAEIELEYVTYVRNGNVLDILNVNTIMYPLTN